MDTSAFIQSLDQRIGARKKMTSPLYQIIMSGRATQRLLAGMVEQRWPIKSFWTRNILGIASRVPDYGLRCSLVENIYEEETGALSQSRRHLETFADFGACVGVARDRLDQVEPLPETEAVVAHNVGVCNGSAHFTAGVASVLLLMEGQPPIVRDDQRSMEWVMKQVYELPPEGYEYFTHHASSSGDVEHVSELEDEHADAARQLLARYCTTDELQAQAAAALDRAIELRHAHFDALVRHYFDEREPAFRYRAAA
ncbi:MAG TPA: iron-containing redox enzyme family protein [Kofleriaceae bacterium]|jgi:pyrroloquinoline-quinone synthase|nr:iron-containing redox enzyme family protein [Kofleriaceae bacterium]